MGRLTERDKDDFCIYIRDSYGMYEFIGTNHDKYDVINKLAHYEDLEEQGRLIEVVRCKDCEHYDTQNCCEGAGWCRAFNAGRFDNGYCHRAKLKELEGDKE